MGEELLMGPLLTRLASQFSNYALRPTYKVDGDKCGETPMLLQRKDSI